MYGRMGYFLFHPPVQRSRWGESPLRNYSQPKMQKDMKKNVIRLEDDACFEITLRNASLGYKENSKLKGQTYSRFMYNGVIFNVNDSLGFKEALAQNDLKVVKLVETTWERINVDANGVETKTTEAGYEFESFVRESDIFARELRKAKHSATINAIGAATTNLTPEMVSALMQASI